jgi:putative protein-disulfide isomerase
MIPTIYYIYDAYCGWCYGFSKQIVAFYEANKNKANFIVLSGNMIPKENEHEVGKTAAYILNAYKNVEETTGVKFGDDYLWHIKNPDLSDWVISSEKSALALTSFLHFLPHKGIEIAADIQHALFAEGRDLCDNEAYRYILDKYEINHDAFYELLKSEKVKEDTYYNFELVQHLGIGSFPTLLLQTEPQKLTLLSQGYATEEQLTEKFLSEIEGK